MRGMPLVRALSAAFLVGAITWPLVGQGQPAGTSEPVTPPGTVQYLPPGYPASHPTSWSGMPAQPGPIPQGFHSAPPAGVPCPPEGYGVYPPPCPPEEEAKKEKEKKEPSITMSYEPGEGLTFKRTDGAFSLKVFGSASLIGVASTDRPFSAGLPLLLLPGSPFGLNTNTYDLHARQSSFGAAFTGPEVCGFTPGAFFLGFIQNDNLTSDAYGLLPYQAYGFLKNDTWRIAGGLQSDVFNPQSPTIISLGKLYGSGNTGSFRGQARLEHFLKPDEAVQVTTQVAIGEPVATLVTNNRRILEDNGWPNVEGRVGLGLGPVTELAGGRKERPVQFGVSGVVGQLRTSRLITAPTDPEVPDRSVVGVWGLGVDGEWAVTECFGLAGELYLGAGLGEYNGGVLQSFNSETFRAIRTRGGWGEAYVYLTDALHLHCGYGIDAPIQRDLAPTQFAKNQTYYANLVWDVSKVVQFSFEVDFRRTDYIALKDADGVLFLSQMLVRF